MYLFPLFKADMISCCQFGNKINCFLFSILLYYLAAIINVNLFRIRVTNMSKKWTVKIKLVEKEKKNPIVESGA